MQSKEFKNKTLEKCLEDANNHFNTNELIYKTLEEKKGILSQTKITILAISKEEVINLTVSTVKDLLDKMNIKYELEINDSEMPFVNITTENTGLLIGKEGNTLAAIEMIIKKIVSNQTELSSHVSIDINNYKQKKINKLLDLIDKLVLEVKKTKIDIRLSSLTAYERKVVHNYLKDDNEVITVSEGFDPDRILFIRASN